MQAGPASCQWKSESANIKLTSRMMVVVSTHWHCQWQASTVPEEAQEGPGPGLPVHADRPGVGGVPVHPGGPGRAPAPPVSDLRSKRGQGPASRPGQASLTLRLTLLGRSPGPCELEATRDVAALVLTGRASGASRSPTRNGRSRAVWVVPTAQQKKDTPPTSSALRHEASWCCVC